MPAVGQPAIDSQYGKGADIYLDEDFRWHPSPVAAYLIPADIRFGERVYLEDLIVERVCSVWNQGDHSRATSGYAVWKGNPLQLKQGEGDIPRPFILG